ncbi:hypothetical protein CONPUDRAFT_144878 [Coniophora puteana RWD-64-598 SS2]|uniref:Uncharacterized protein n=1 Tax=Coniophora puteana (strain RWD-64-598) TaxID=741705 RepID=A0A5M3MKX5_CONPW|nr:uncharacterized protein CONPUDRAFT_144878 [Coniophora puteana RWD-64-598 SS2]EIW79677.1 hypothetical protein CONPUDRAFT_144878 [Coniophora puteana RWD-64-598 SS2]
MLLRLIPPSPQPTVLYTLGFAQSLPLPLPRAWSAQHQLLTSVLALPAPVSIHALDRSASLVALAHDVSLDVAALEVRVTFVDGRLVTLPMEDGLVRMLENVMADVRRSSGDNCSDADTNEEECSTRSSSPTASPLTIFKKHKRQRSLLLSLISSAIPRVILGPPTRPATPQPPSSPTTPTTPTRSSTPSSLSKPAVLPPRPSDPDENMDASALRRRARSTLVDAWRRHVQSAIVSGFSEERAQLVSFPNAGYIEWVVRGRMDEVLIQMAQLRTEGRKFWLEQRSRHNASAGREREAPPRLITSASPVDIANKKRSKSVRVEETKVPPRERARAKSRNRIPSPFPRDADSDDWGIKDGRSGSEEVRAMQSPSPPLTAPDDMADLLTYDFELELPATGEGDDFSHDDYKLEVVDPFRLQRSSPRDARKQKLKQRWEIGYTGTCVCLCTEEGACGLVCEDDRECQCGSEDASTSCVDKRSSLDSSESETSVKTPPDEGNGVPIPLPLPAHLARAKKAFKRSFSKHGTSSSPRTPGKFCQVKLPTHLATRYSMLTGQLSSLRNALIVIRIRAEEEAWQIVRPSVVNRYDPLCGECARKQPVTYTTEFSMTPTLMDLEERARRRAWSNGITMDAYRVAHRIADIRLVTKESGPPKPPPGLDACGPPSYDEAIARSPPSLRPIQPRGIEMGVPIASSPLTCYMWNAEDLAAEGYTLDYDDVEDDDARDIGSRFIVEDVAVKRERKSLRRTSSRPQLFTVCEETASDTETECQLPSSETRTCSSPEREPGEIGATFATTAMEFPHDAFDEDDLENGGYLNSSDDPIHSSPPPPITECRIDEERDDGPFSSYTPAQNSTSARIHGGSSTPDLTSLSSPALPVYRPTPITPKSADELPGRLDASALLFQPLSQFASEPGSTADDTGAPARRVPSTASSGRRDRIHSLPIAFKPSSNAHDLSREYALPPPECSSDDPATAFTTDVAPVPTFPYAHMQVHHKKDGQDRHRRSEEGSLVPDGDDISLGLDIALGRAEEGQAEW